MLIIWSLPLTYLYPVIILRIKSTYMFRADTRDTKRARTFATIDKE